MEQTPSHPDVRIITLRRPYRFESPFGDQSFVLLLHSDDSTITVEEQSTLAEEIVGSGCRYVCCSGLACEEWHDAVDDADVIVDPNTERLIMTTWHDEESLAEVVWFALTLTSFENFVPERFLIALLSPKDGRVAEVTASVKDTVQ